MFTLVALGGNLPNGLTPPLQTILAAISDIQNIGFAVKNCSNFYQTPAFPAGSGPDYVNCAVQLEAHADITPQQVLGHLAAVEAAHGRTRAQRWGGRTLDLDLLACDDQVLPDLAEFHAWADLNAARAATIAPQQLILPHPRLHERAFVLVPLMDIAADWVHPVLGKSVRQMHDALPQGDRASVIALKP